MPIVLKQRARVAKQDRPGRRGVGMLCRKLGIPWYPHREPKPCWQRDAGWTGTALCGMTPRAGIRPMDLFHELGHWLVADPEHQGLPDFGEQFWYAPTTQARREASILEACASAVGIWLQLQVEGEAAAKRHTNDHGWESLDVMLARLVEYRDNPLIQRAHARLLAAGLPVFPLETPSVSTQDNP